jgi:hypothetical protein
MNFGVGGGLMDGIYIAQVDVEDGAAGREQAVRQRLHPGKVNGLIIRRSYSMK